LAVDISTVLSPLVLRGATDNYQGQEKGGHEEGTTCLPRAAQGGLCSDIMAHIYANLLLILFVV